MEQNFVTLKFKNRATCDKGIAEQYNNGGPFDVELQTNDGKSVSAHRFLLAMYSKTWSNALRVAGLNGVIILPIDQPYHTTKKMIELLYLREINVLEEEKQAIWDAFRSLKITGFDESIKPLPPIPSFEESQKMARAANIGQRRNSMAVVSQAPGKRTLQRSQSVHPDQLREHAMANSMSSYRPAAAQNPNRTNVEAGFKKPPPQASRPAGGPIQSAQNRPTQPPPQGQMVTQNRQSPYAAMNQLKQQKQNPAAAVMQKQGPAPANVQATQIPSKIPTSLPPGITIMQAPRKNQQQQQQQPRTFATQPEVTIAPIASNQSDEVFATPTAVTATAAAVGNVTQNDRFEEEIDNLPIDMEIDEAIGNSETNDGGDNGSEKTVDNGGNEDNLNANNGMDDAGIGEMAADTNNNNIKGQSADQTDHDDIDDEFNDFDGEHFEGYDDSDVNNIKPDMQTSDAQ